MYLNYIQVAPQESKIAFCYEPEPVIPLSSNTIDRGMTGDVGDYRGDYKKRKRTT
jgi:hypothetical protein